MRKMLMVVLIVLMMGGMIKAQESAIYVTVQDNAAPARRPPSAL
jgi:hypothetical protein